ncbi:GTP 3',8-cyclase MoaA [Candidatus Poseidoniaceae archaeon]|nr:GTP 3',8-cyclase MoaA [Candidatus Poseidoniaceae archaeon]
MSIVDSLGRPLRDLRISITDRCNFRCTYCMPRENFGPEHTFLAKQEILSYEEMTTVVESLLPLGLQKIRITGGEPLMRKDLRIFIAMLRGLDAEIDIALTTNGVLLKKHASNLFNSGLNRVTVSIDAIDLDMFQSITDSKNKPEEVFAGIETAQQCGLTVKVNCVVKKGVNEEQIVPLVKACSSRNIPIRFIEFMDVGTTNNWNLESVVTGEEMRQRISQHFGPLSRNTANHPSDVARMWSLKNGTEIGFIESVSSPFCGDCSRARLSAHGSMYTCLFSEKGFDIRGILRFGASSEDVAELIQGIWIKRDDRYSEMRGQANIERHPVEMSFIGG